MFHPTLTPLDLARRHVCGESLAFFDGPPDAAWCGAYWNPAAVFTSRDGAGVLRWRGGPEERLDGDPFRLLDALLCAHPDLTAAGYWSYDLRHHVERLPRIAHNDLHLPDCHVGLYEGSGLGESGRVGEWGSGRVGEWAADAAPIPNPETAASRDPRGPSVPRTSGHSGAGTQYPTPNTQHPIPNTQHPTPNTQYPIPNTPRSAYEAAVRRVLEYIAAGDCYQVNLSHRLSAPLRGSPWELYERLRAASPAPYAAYLDCGDHQVLSSSPELFLRVRDGEVETRPIKGTRPRGRTPDEDAALAAELLASPKDRAELLMIVDLERNDLGRVCEYGSVRVPDLFRLESYASVHHLVATVQGRLRADVTPLECLRASFPGGSITGAPKIRAMEIIEQLEPTCRGVYTGAIGWVDGRGNAEWSIAIRTLVVKNGHVYLQVGGGIVADSDPAAEYEETLAKARGMLEALQVGTCGNDQQ